MTTAPTQLPPLTLADRARFWQAVLGLDWRAAVRIALGESHTSLPVANGHGNRAARRAAQIETAAWHDAQGGLTEADVDRLAESLGEDGAEVATAVVRNFRDA